MQDLLDVYGQPLLQFILNLPDTEFDGRALSEEQAEASQVLRELCEQTRDQDETVRWLNLSSMLTAFVPELQTSAAIHFRSHCGGATETPLVEDDSIGQNLLVFARDVYAGFLVKRPASEWMGGMPAAHYLGKHPKFVEFCNSVLKDQRLKFLFPGHMDTTTANSFAELIGVSSITFTVAGGGGGMQLVMLVDNILRSAYARCSLNDEVSLAHFLRVTLDVLEELRELAAGRSVSVPVAVGLVNVSFADLDRLSLPNGELRRVREADANYVPKSDQTEAVLTFEVPFKLLAKKKVPDDDSFLDHGPYVPHVEKWRNGLQEAINLRLLAIMLASTSGHRAAAIVISQSVFDPISMMPHMSWQEHAPATTAEKVCIAREEAEQIQIWTEKVLREQPKNLGVAMRRIISAVGTRMDPVDGLVDAVLAWENMFSGTPETSLRVCGSLAILLEPDDFNKRNSLYGELAKIYGTRSDIVHGKANEPSTAQVLEQRARAVEIAVQAMRRLYEFPDLLQAENSSVRGKNVMLGRVQAGSQTVAGERSGAGAGE